MAKHHEQQPASDDRQNARAPYNFVPLPVRAVDVRDQFNNQSLDDALPPHNIYRSDRLHGYFDVTLTTESPLYIRGPLTRSEAEPDQRDLYRNKPDFFHTGDPNIPVIPGSSLRGMLRSLVEIVTWSKLTRISDTPKIFYRAVAAPADDPLGEDYKKVTGKLGANIKAGYLHRDENGNWFIHPASSDQDKQFFKVRSNEKNGKPHSDTEQVIGLIPLNSAKYRMQYHDVKRNGQTRTVKSGIVIGVRSLRENEQRDGVLVCTGNMAESGTKSGTVSTNRNNFIFVLERDPESTPIQIDPQAVIDYRDGLTPFQKEPPFDPQYGCLIQGRPVFYIEPPQTGQFIRYFGHSPFFRIPATIKDKGLERAVTPRDLVPRDLHNTRDHIDLTEGLFGFVRDNQEIDKEIPQGDRRRAYAGRIIVTDGVLSRVEAEIWDLEVTPPILSGPKPTTFQHYLEQPQGSKTPKQQLHHYDSKLNGKPAAKVRGHKLYWRQRRQAVADIPETTRDPLQANDSQHTRIRPVRRGLIFSFRVSFDNLTDIELGALAWVLNLGSEEHYPDARHMLGMGKPFGLGVVRVQASLTLTHRIERYRKLFAGNEWDVGYSHEDINRFIAEFETFMRQQVGAEHYDQRLSELLTMLQGRDPNPLFDYMTIEPNMFKDRPVLPAPSEVIPSPEKLAQMAAERAEAERRNQEAADALRRREEAERERAERRMRGPQKGDLVRGKITEVPEHPNDDIPFKVIYEDGSYEGYVMAKYRRDSHFAVGGDITALVLEVEQGEGVTYLWCRRATKEEKDALKKR